MKKKITSLALSAVLVLLAVFALNNEKIVNAADNLVLLEKRHPEYWMWLHCGTGIDLDGDNLKDVFVCPISKMYIDEIKDDYHLFLRDSTRSDPRRVVYFFDGTGIDVQNNIYGTVDTNSWTIVDGQNFDWTDIKCEEKPINQITDIYQYLDELKNQSFIISAKDEAAGAWNVKLQGLLEADGLNGGFNYRDSYIAVVENGRVVSEQVSHAPIEYEMDNFYVKSAGFDTKSPESIISFNGTDYSVKGRGLNIVVFNKGEVIDSVAFDTSSRIIKASRK